MWKRENAKETRGEESSSAAVRGPTLEVQGSRTLSGFQDLSEFLDLSACWLWVALRLQPRSGGLAGEVVLSAGTGGAEPPRSPRPEENRFLWIHLLPPWTPPLLLT